MSETGDMLSPKVAPPMMAPIRMTGSVARPAAAGYRRGAQRIMVPRLVPVAVETRQQIRNEATANRAAVNSELLGAPHESVDKAARVDEARQNPGEKPGQNHQTARSAGSCPVLPCQPTAIDRWPASSLLPSAMTSTGQKPRSSGAPDSPSQATPARNRAKGARVPHAPPRNTNSLSCESESLITRFLSLAESRAQDTRPRLCPTHRTRPHKMIERKEQPWQTTLTNSRSGTCGSKL